MTRSSRTLAACTRRGRKARGPDLDDLGIETTTEPGGDGRKSTEWNPSALSALPDQRRTSLETAYYAGFFEWPRVVAGEDGAASLDIAPSAFHRHPRKAEGRVLGPVLPGPA